MALTQKLLIVGGNGFVGSAVCRAALARSWDVISISSSGKPFHTPRGHIPVWTRNVQWHTASALDPDSYRVLLRDCTAVVSSVGTLLETTQYKHALRTGDVRKLISALLPGSSDPLKRGEKGSYEMLNRDTAVTVCETYRAEATQSVPRTFVYLSAEDMGRPLIPRRYIETKRQAEARIADICKGSDIRDVFIRPSFIYHPHLRPISSPMAALMSLSATVNAGAPAVIPTPSRILRAVSSEAAPGEIPSAARGLAATMELPPVHLDHVAEAICNAIVDPDIRGPIGLKEIRRLAGWQDA